VDNLKKVLLELLTSRYSPSSPNVYVDPLSLKSGLALIMNLSKKIMVLISTAKKKKHALKVLGSMVLKKPSLEIKMLKKI